MIGAQICQYWDKPHTLSWDVLGCLSTLDRTAVLPLWCARRYRHINLHLCRGVRCEIPEILGRQQKNLVGGIPTPLKNRKVNWDDYYQYMEK